MPRLLAIEESFYKNLTNAHTTKTVPRNYRPISELYLTS